MHLALFDPGTKKQVSLPITMHQKTINNRQILYKLVFYSNNLSKKKNQKKLRERIALAHKEGTSIYGISPSLSRYLDNRHKLLADGQKLTLAFLPQTFDSSIPGWRKSFIAIPVNNDFMFNAARIIAQEVKWLHLFSADPNTLNKAAEIIYQESGLITSCDYYYPSGTEIVLAPPGQKIIPEEPDLIWQKWPQSIKDNNTGEIFPFYWGESFILATMDQEKLSLFQNRTVIHQSRQLYRYSINYGFSTSGLLLDNHDSKRSLISSILSK